MGVGQDTFSQTNIEEVSASSKKEYSSQASNAGAGTAILNQKTKYGRYAFHAAALIVIIGVATAGRINSSLAISTKGIGSSKNQTSMIATGAVLASGTQSLIAQDIAQQARELTNISSLATSGDDFLSNKSSVIASGAVSRDVITYKVKPGDNLDTLASKFNITSDTIKWANDIQDGDNIKQDSELTILPVNGIMYTAQEGDDISLLATKYQSSASLIDSFNALEGKAIGAGAKLIIPDGIKPAVVAPTVRVGSVSTGVKSGAASAYSMTASAGNNYSYGYCTWYVANRRYVASSLGNANQWPYNAPRAGMTVGNSPVAGSAGVAKYLANHVVYIERVEGGTVYYTEMNGPAGWGRVNSGSAPASNFIYIY